jgi:hypothetical protein
LERSVVAGAIGGALALVVLAAVAALLMRRVGPRMMPLMMERMMKGGARSEEMAACMERCGCGRPASDGEPPADR